MSIAKRLKAAITTFRSTDKLPIEWKDGRWWMPITGTMSAYNGLEYIKAFTEIPEVNAVITRKARMWSKGEIKIVSKQTGEQVKNYEYLVKVLRNPNWYQAQKEFLMQTKLFREIAGNEYLYFIKAFGTPFKSVRALYTLPPQLVKSITPQEKPFFEYLEPVVKYKFKWGNETYDLDESAVIQFNDNRVDVNPKNWVQGTSKLEALKVPINNIRAAYESRNVMLNNRGAAGFLSPDYKDAAGQVPMTEEEKKAVQEEFLRYGTLSNQWQFIISNNPMKFVSIGVNDPVKLGMFTEIEADFQRIIDAYGLDRDMFGNEKGATFENKKQGERAAWNNTIIPEFVEWVDGLNDVFNTSAESWKLVSDFSGIPVLQENASERGRAIYSVVQALSLALQDQVISAEDYQRELNRLGFEL